MTQDQVFVPPTRSGLDLPPLDAAREDSTGEHVTKEVMAEMWEALGDSPISAAFMGALQLVGLQMGLQMWGKSDLGLTAVPSNSSSDGRCIFFRMLLVNPTTPR
jgi:hypothetical protein